jgi:hypothetical protein
MGLGFSSGGMGKYTREGSRLARCMVMENLSKGNNYFKALSNKIRRLADVF